MRRGAPTNRQHASGCRGQGAVDSRTSPSTSPRASKGGFSSQRNDDGSLTVFDPDGRVIAPVPPPVALPDSGAVILRNEAAKNGITIDPRTNLVRHNGEGLDLAMAVDALLPIAYKLNAAQRVEG
jgi:hypothetical protein